HDLRGRDALRLVHLDRDAAPVVVDRDARVDVDGDRDARAVANERLVDRVVDDLEDEMMETALARVSDVHARALAHGLQPLEDLDVRGAVGGPGLGRAHGPPKSSFVTLSRFYPLEHSDAIPMRQKFHRYSHGLQPFPRY